VILAFAAAFPLLDERGMRGTPTHRLFGIAVTVTTAFLTGFAMGAPHAILNLSAYLQGVAALKHQYGGGHPPHMAMRGGIAGQAWLISTYYAAVLGAPAVLLHVAGYGGNRLAPSKFAYVVILTFTMAGFLMQKVFFERNFSPLLPVFVFIAMLGISNMQRWAKPLAPATASARHIALAAIASMLFASTLYRSLPVTLKLSRHFTPTWQAETNQRRDAFVQGWKALVGAARVEWLPYGLIFRGKYPDKNTECVLYGFIAYNDDWSNRYVRRMPASLHVLDRLPSDFNGIPVSTLHAYHSPTIYLFADNRACPLRTTTSR
jgi:hypothetical protein